MTKLCAQCGTRTAEDAACGCFAPFFAASRLRIVVDRNMPPGAALLVDPVTRDALGGHNAYALRSLAAIDIRASFTIDTTGVP